MISYKKSIESYSDIIDLPYAKSKAHSHMTPLERAAQFAPFAALVGHSDEIKEEARVTSKEIILTEEETAQLNLMLLEIANSPKDKCYALTYFVPDEKKDGGSYVTKKGFIKKLDEFEEKIILSNGEEIKMKRLISIKSL